LRAASLAPEGCQNPSSGWNLSFDTLHAPEWLGNAEVPEITPIRFSARTGAAGSAALSTSTNSRPRQSRQSMPAHEP
jgi:hypothetical protein